CLVRVLLSALSLAAAVTTIAAAQFPQPSGFAVDDPVLRRIWAIETDSSDLPRLAQVLFDSLGPRLTGSPGMNAAQNWVVTTYGGWGITARKEQYGTWRSWRRGTTHIDLVAPRVRSLEGTMLAWSPPTPRGKPLRAPVVILPDVADSAGLVAWLPQARGKFVLISSPQPTCRPDDSWEKWATQSTADSMKARRTAAQQAWQQRLQRTGYAGTGTVAAVAPLSRRLEVAGVAGIIGSLWSQGWGVQKVFQAFTDRAPVLDIACEDYGLLYRLAENKQGPIVEVTAESQALGEVPVFNVVGEIKGSELPNEYVMLSAHFDSWDGGSGDCDYGRYTWHTNRDTYDKLSFDDVKNNAALTAMLVYLAAQDTTRMSREKRTVFQPTPQGNPGSWPECRDAQRSTPPLAPAPPPPPAARP